MDRNWDTALGEMIPEFVGCNSTLEYKLSVWRMTSRLNDSHALLKNIYTDCDLINYIRKNGHPGVLVQFIERKLTVTRILIDPKFSNLNVGDIITKIDGVPIQRVIDSLMQFSCASNASTAFRDMPALILYSEQKHRTFSILRAKKEMEVEVLNINPSLFKLLEAKSQEQSEMKEDKWLQIFDGNIGLLRACRITKVSPYLENIFLSLKSTKGLIIDLRGYLIVDLIDNLNYYLLSKPAPFVVYTRSSLNNPGCLLSLQQTRCIH